MENDYVLMEYKEFRNLFEEINKKLASQKLSEMKELKKIFPSKVLFKKQNNEKLMQQRLIKLNEYFEKLMELVAKKGDNRKTMNIKMTIMTILTHHLTK